MVVLANVSICTEPSACTTGYDYHNFKALIKTIVHVSLPIINDVKPIKNII